MLDEVQSRSQEISRSGSFSELSFVKLQEILKSLKWADTQVEQYGAGVYECPNEMKLADYLEQQVGFSEKGADTQARNIMIGKLEKFLVSPVIGFSEEQAKEHAASLYDAKNVDALSNRLKKILPDAQEMEIDDLLHFIVVHTKVQAEQLAGPDVLDKKVRADFGSEKLYTYAEESDSFSNAKDKVFEPDEFTHAELGDAEDQFSGPTRLPYGDMAPAATEDALPALKIASVKNKKTISEDDVFGKELERDMGKIAHEEALLNQKNNKDLSGQVTIAMNKPRKVAKTKKADFSDEITQPRISTNTGDFQDEPTFIKGRPSKAA